jgi:hypothetical protein
VGPPLRRGRTRRDPGSARQPDGRRAAAPEECVIFQTTDSPQVFLLDHDANGEQVKRWITTAEAMDRFQFDWAKIKRWDVPLASLGLPDGPDISWP